MDIATALWLDSKPDDSYWETYRGRDYSERDWVSNFYGVSEMFDGNENAWSTLARHERMAEAMYEV